MGYVRKKNLFTLLSVNASDVREKRKEWNKIISEFDANSLVYLDESGVNTNLTRHYARAHGGARATDHTPLNTPANTTILSFGLT